MTRSYNRDLRVQSFAKKSLGGQIVYYLTFCDLNKLWQKTQKFHFQSRFSLSEISLIILEKKLGKRLGAQYCFFDNFMFWNCLFSKIRLYFCQLILNWTYVQSKNNLTQTIFSAIVCILLGCATLCSKPVVMLNLA